MEKEWLDFADLDLILKVTPALWMSNFDQKQLVCILSLKPNAGFWPNFMYCIIGMVKRFHYILVTMSQFSRFPHYKDCKNEPCLHSISWTNRWILTKLAQKDHWDKGRMWLDFGDLGLIFKVTSTLWMSNFDSTKACLHLISWTKWWIQAKLHVLYYWDKINNLIRIWWPWPNFQGHHTIKTAKISLICSISCESMHGFWPNCQRHIIGTGKRSDKI